MRIRIIAFILTLWILPIQIKAQSGTVTFIVSQIDTQKGGELSAGIFNKEYFPQVGKQLFGKEVLVISGKMEFSFEQIPVGTYAGVVFQDVNQDKELKTNFVGYPKEPIGFPNDAKIKFGPPSFDDAKIEVRENDTTFVYIKLN